MQCASEHKLILVLLFTFSTLTITISSVNAVEQSSSLDSAKHTIAVRSENPISLVLEAVTEKLFERNDTPVNTIQQLSTTTLTTVVASAAPTTSAIAPANGSEDSKEYAYHVLKCNIGRTADECYHFIGTYYNSSTSVIFRQGNANTYFDCTETLGHCVYKNVAHQGYVYSHSCT
ncbi:hypothetical protein BKA65DRAFT_554685 [Rhexocercosporidium sp. MPI-PUGE-AT-0058]|nr:hypothetical protein BKA65DRAFT_554685 [Rhexocercosporidium sp. MPI-PUGE-AT-0058]